MQCINYCNQVSHMSKINLIETFAAGFKGISRFIIEFSTEQKEFVKDLRFSLAHTARQRYPDKSISQLSHTTGLLRAQIDDALDEDFPVAVMDKESIILGDLWRNRDKDGLIALNGADISFHTIASEHLKNKYSISSVLETLIKSGAVEKHDEDLLILTNAFTPNKNEEIVINLTGLVINRFIGTVIHNRHAKDKKRIYQSTYKSSKIPPHSRNDLHEALFAQCEIAMHDFIKIIEQFEADVPNGHYPECGISMFEFDAKQNNKGENNE